MAPTVFWGTRPVPGPPATGGRPEALILMGDWCAVWPLSHEPTKTGARDATLHRAQSGNLMTPDGRSGWETEFVLAPGPLMADPATRPGTVAVRMPRRGPRPVGIRHAQRMLLFYEHVHDDPDS